MIDDGKYIVFSAATLDRLIQQLVGDEVGLIPNDLQRHRYHKEVHDALAHSQLHDAVVIRHRDVFAAPALYAYASAVATAVEILEMNHGVSKEQIDYLKDLADYFAGHADTARMMAGKMPDAESNEQVG